MTLLMPIQSKISLTEKFLSSLKGKKTYLVVIVMLAYAIYGGYTHELNAQQVYQLILQALAFAGIRAGIASNVK